MILGRFLATSCRTVSWSNQETSSKQYYYRVNSDRKKKILQLSGIKQSSWSALNPTLFLTSIINPEDRGEIASITFEGWSMLGRPAGTSGDTIGIQKDFGINGLKKINCCPRIGTLFLTLRNNQLQKCRLRNSIGVLH